MFLDQSVTFNMVAATFSDWAKQGIVNDRIIKKVVDEKVDQLRIKTPNNEQILQYLSGGNQQKVLIGRWLCRNFDVVIFSITHKHPLVVLTWAQNTKFSHLLTRLQSEERQLLLFPLK